LYPLISLPICVCYLFLYCDRKNFTISVIVYVTLTFLITGASVFIAEYFGGSLPLNISVLSRKEKMIMRSINILYAAVSLFGFTLLFYIEMTNLMDKLRQSTDKLKYTATHDALTGLTNRRSFWEYFDLLCRDGKHYNIAMGDLDSFKKINDTYGHGCGDLVLRSVADIIKESTNENEIACRWGGEEMVVVFMGERSEALKRLEQIRSQIESLSLNYEGLNVNVTMTFGFADSEELKRAISESNSEMETTEESEMISKHFGVESLISMVDKRLYTGKGIGKNVVVDK
ncbi:MAG: GGDEF domain-containing protein, partial [Oscillospiraceae bacterium]|nr:GGDEF domain-containing protein [Oscillospiraceae bacterium]